MPHHLPEGVEVDLSIGPELLRHSPEEGFDRITRLAAQFFDMPLACFVVIDRDGGWIKSRSGPDLLPGVEQVLVHALRFQQQFQQQDVMLVHDLSRDPRFASLPQVAMEPSLRFYAGAAVCSSDRSRIGVLGLLDVQARRFGADKIALLADFAKLLDREVAAIQSRQIMFQQYHSERAIRQLIDYLPEGILLLGDDGTIVSCNAVAEKMYRATRRGLVGVATSELTADDPQRLGDMLEAGMVDQIQARARRVDGSEFPAEFSIKILDAASVHRYALIVRDISARKEKERLAHIAEARRQSYFVTATHELRTPMASVLGFSELLLKRDFDPDEGRQLIEIVHRQATRLVNLINEMLDLARIEAGGREGLDLRVVNPSAILDATLSGLSGLGADHRLRSRSSPTLPALTADAGKLQQALTNIISNAVKYSDDRTEIGVELFETSMSGLPAIGFQVADQGIGMTADEKAHIYEPFFRASGKSEAPGTGLGMTIFKEIIDLHNGLVEIESTPGRGTTVTFVLPIMPSDDRESMAQ